MNTIKAAQPNEITLVNVAEYRDLIDALSQAFASLRSAANEAEREREAAWVRRIASDLMRTTCLRAKPSDHERAERLIDATASYLIQHGLNAKGPHR